MHAFADLTLTRTTAISKLNTLLFSAADETVISVVFKDAVSVPDASPVMPSAAPVVELLADLGATGTAQMNRHPGSSESDLWNDRRTRFPTEKYKEINPLVGPKGGFWQVSFTLSVNCSKINLNVVCLGIC